MIESLRNLKTSEIELRQPLPVLECEWLVGRLLAKQGIAAARWVGNTRRLLVEYDADRFGSAELIAFFQSCGVPVAAVRAGLQVSRS
jgi:hypothetical protein